MGFKFKFILERKHLKHFVKKMTYISKTLKYVYIHIYPIFEV